MTPLMAHPHTHNWMEVNEPKTPANYWVQGRGKAVTHRTWGGLGAVGLLRDKPRKRRKTRRGRKR